MRRPVLRALLIVLGVSLLGLGMGAFLWWKARPALKLQAASRVKLIDDFNDGAEPNLIGGESFTQTPSTARLSPAILRMPTPSEGDMALSMTYELPAGVAASWGTGLNDLDISAATAVRLWLKVTGQPPQKLHIELVDGAGARAQAEVVVPGGGRWKPIEIPARTFTGINFDRLGRFILRIGAQREAVKGELAVDDIEFVGPALLFTRSLEDNLLGSPRAVLVKPRHLLSLPPKERLRAIAGDTWGYFRDLVDRRHHLPLNYIQLAPQRRIGDYASTTDVAMYLMSVVSAVDFDFIDHASAQERIKQTLEQLQQLPRWKSFFYNYYNTTNLQITNRYISSVDNGWLAAALIVIRQAFPQLAHLANALLDPMDFEIFYDPDVGQIRLGYDTEKGQFAPYHYGLLATEARIISVIAIGKGDVPERHWFRIYRTLPKEWTWQRQAPQGQFQTYRGYDVFQGYYTYTADSQPIPIVPSWGGSLFEFLMPTMIIDEQRLAPHGLGLNDQRAVDLHIRYALREREFPVWGLSPCATPNDRHGGYSEYGVAALGAKGYKDEAIVTPHVAMLALPFAPEAAEENIRQFLTRYPMYGPYGLYDSVDVATGDVAYKYLALDQGMSLIALNNHLNNGAIQRRFRADPIMRRAEWLLKEERFFGSETLANAP